MAQNYQVDVKALDKIPSVAPTLWVPFLEEEFISSIAKCNNLSNSGPDKLSYRHLKSIINNKACLRMIINITNVCFKLGHWPSHFKTSMMIVIPKPNKELYDSPKSFYPIVLLKILEKLIEKVISDHLQFHTISNNFIHQSQLSSLKHRSTTNIGVILIHFIYMGWIRNNMTSTLSFGIAQFFPLLNHFIFSYILRKVSFNSKVKHFFSNYCCDDHLSNDK